MIGERTFWLTRFLILRLLGLIYAVAFLTLVNQGLPLIGHHGLLPADLYLDRVAEHFGGRGAAAAQVPTLFWLTISDPFLTAMSWAGLILSLVVLAGYANGILMAVLWALYLSFYQIGQSWYSFGWEIQLLETGFLSIFFVPLLDGRPFPGRPPNAVLWLYRWLAFRIMLGAGLIKIRGDACWRDLTCLAYHYETQPVPGPLSRALHFMPLWFHKGGALFNHLAELVMPWLLFWPRWGSIAAGVTMLLFQIVLIVSGNLSFLNWLTIVPVLACFDDALLARVLPARLSAAASRAAAAAQPARAQQVAVGLLIGLVAILSINPVSNLLSAGQAMNTSFDRLFLVNTYGAFGSVGKERPEIVLEGTDDEVITEGTVWKEYEFKCKPGDPGRRPCLITPYHYRLDWLMWFAAMSSPDRYPWSAHLVWKLLAGDPGAQSLLAGNPFPARPPRYIRAQLYRYEFAPAGEADGAWWRRELHRCVAPAALRGRSPSEGIRGVARLAGAVTGLRVRRSSPPSA